jgi:hypothetical protein
MFGQESLILQAVNLRGEIINLDFIKIDAHE